MEVIIHAQSGRLLRLFYDTANQLFVYDLHTLHQFQNNFSNYLFQCTSLRVNNESANKDILWNKWMGFDGFNGFCGQIQAYP